LTADRRPAALRPAYDPRRRRVVLFSGGAALESTEADTWEWEGANWNRLG